MVNTEIAYGKWLTSRKKFAEADQVLRAAAKLKGASAEIYWNIADGKEISESACRKIPQLLANQTLMF